MVATFEGSPYLRVFNRSHTAPIQIPGCNDFTDGESSGWEDEPSDVEAPHRSPAFQASGWLKLRQYYSQTSGSCGSQARCQSLFDDGMPRRAASCQTPITMRGFPQAAYLSSTATPASAQVRSSLPLRKSLLTEALQPQLCTALRSTLCAQSSDELDELSLLLQLQYAESTKGKGSLQTCRRALTFADESSSFHEVPSAWTATTVGVQTVSGVEDGYGPTATLQKGQASQQQTGHMSQKKPVSPAAAKTQPSCTPLLSSQERTKPDTPFATPACAHASQLYTHDGTAEDNRRSRMDALHLSNYAEGYADGPDPMQPISPEPKQQPQWRRGVPSEDGTHKLSDTSALPTCTPDCIPTAPTSVARARPASTAQSHRPPRDPQHHVNPWQQHHAAGCSRQQADLHCIERCADGPQDASNAQEQQRSKHRRQRGRRNDRNTDVVAGKSPQSRGRGAVHCLGQRQLTQPQPNNQVPVHKRSGQQQQSARAQARIPKAEAQAPRAPPPTRLRADAPAFVPSFMQNN